MGMFHARGQVTSHPVWCLPIHVALHACSLVTAGSSGRPVHQQDKHREHALEELPRLFLGVRFLQMHGHVTASSMVHQEALVQAE